MPVHRPLIGILGGTSFQHAGALAAGRERWITTPFGRVPAVLTDRLAMIRRHGPEGTIPPHRVPHRAHVWALKRLGVPGIVSFGSVGGLREQVPPGTLVLADDTYAPHRTVTFHDNTLAITIPRMDPDWRAAVGKALTTQVCGYADGGVYAEALGPRFETPAEVRALAQVADVVGMTCASEAALARELDLPHAILGMVDNWAVGIGNQPLTDKEFAATVKINRLRVEAALAAVATLKIPD